MSDLQSAAQAVLDRWDSPKWEWVNQGPTGELMHVLRLALSQPAPQPLTRKQVQDLVIAVCDNIYPQDDISYSEADSVFYGAFVHAIEAAHNIAPPASTKDAA